MPSCPHIKPIDAVVVGMYDKHIDQYAVNAEYVRGCTSVNGVFRFGLGFQLLILRHYMP
jgi:hypothetical protein